MDETEEEVEIEVETNSENEEQNHNYNLRRRSGGSGSSGSSSANRVRLNRIPGMPGIIARLIQAVTNNDEGSDSSDDSDFDPENVEEPAFFWPSTRRRAPKEKSPPKPKAEWIEKLKNTDFYGETVLGLGEDLQTCHRFRVKSNLLNVIQNREVRL